MCYTVPSTWRSAEEVSKGIFTRHLNDRAEAVVVELCVEIWALSFLLLYHLFQSFRLSYRIILQTVTRLWDPAEPVLPRAHTRVGRSLDKVDLQSWLQRYREYARELRQWNSFLLSPRLSAKIRRACAVARANGFRLIWIDSCCIDKTSSSELSEAINSMYAWYRAAAVCYAYLSDVPAAGDPRGDYTPFSRSRWFRRGWTLQELIAPKAFFFLSRDWHFLGSKSSLADTVAGITRIDRRVLTHTRQLADTSVAERMSWASTRMTTRVEDEVYSLLGIFDINMPTLYGEGRRAFTRLQEEILKRIPDQTLFAWGRIYPLLDIAGPRRHTRRIAFQTRKSTLVARGPWNFKSSQEIRPISHDVFLERLGIDPGVVPPTSTVTPYGLHTQLPLIPIEHFFPQYSLVDSQPEHYSLMFLACETSASDLIAEPHVLAVLCSVESRSGTGQVPLIQREEFHVFSWRVVDGHRELLPCTTQQPRSLVAVPAARFLKAAAAWRKHALPRGLYAPLDVSTMTIASDQQAARRWGVGVVAVRLQLAPWTANALRQLGYTLTGDLAPSTDRCFQFQWLAILTGINTQNSEEEEAADLDLRYHHFRVSNGKDIIEITYPSLVEASRENPLFVVDVLRRGDATSPDSEARVVIPLSPETPQEEVLAAPPEGIITVRFTMHQCAPRRWYLDVDMIR